MAEFLVRCETSRSVKEISEAISLSLRYRFCGNYCGVAGGILLSFADIETRRRSGIPDTVPVALSSSFHAYDVGGFRP